MAPHADHDQVITCSDPTVPRSVGVLEVAVSRS